MTPIDVTTKWWGGQSSTDPEKQVAQLERLLKSMTMSFMLLLSQQENMCCEFTVQLLKSFPYEAFRLTTMEDPMTGAISWVLTSDEEEVH